MYGLLDRWSLSQSCRRSSRARMSRQPLLSLISSHCASALRSAGTSPSRWM
nr:MAG TPA: hypothetical protein [Caudoviricetes sp.]